MEIDIVNRVKKDFNDEAEEAIRILNTFEKNHNFSSRVTRCIVFLSKGDLIQLRSLIEQAKLDWRDVIVDAEDEPLQYNNPFKN